MLSYAESLPSAIKMVCSLGETPLRVLKGVEWVGLDPLDTLEPHGGGGCFAPRKCSFQER